MPNHLQSEKSPHLKQHATNPVDWYPWCKEAFAAAVSQDRPIFVSIGYFTCHWCHVMERETFSDPVVGAALNAHFISIKVDREEHPDVDRVFLAFLQATIGVGGWPMNIFLTPEGKPIFGSTFIPAKAQPPHQGFLALVEDFAQRWKDTTGQLHLKAQAQDIACKMHQALAADPVAPGDLEDFFLPANADRVLLKCLDDFESSFDGRFGGFDRRPKFPTPSVFHFLAAIHCRLLERVRQSARRFLADGAGFEEPAAHATAAPEVDLLVGDPKREVTEQDIEKAQGLRSEAQALAADGKLEEAIATITKAVLVNPCSAVLYAVRAEMLLRQGHVNAAIRDCDEAIRITPVAARPYKVRGKARMKQGKWEEAALDLGKANQIDYDDDTYALLKELQADKLPKAIEKRKRLEQQQQIGITEAKATHCLHMLMFSLHCISQGGIHDHIGGGFARYSVDEVWHVPRFEKMLSDNAQLVIAYILALQVDGRPLFANAIRDTVSFIQCELLHPDGGFYTALHADSEETPGSGNLVEGAFYVWTFPEVKQLVGDLHPKALDIVLPSFGIRPDGNVPPSSDPAGHFRGKNVLFVEKPLEVVGEELHLPPAEVAQVVNQCRVRMLERRSTRPRPMRDSKILTSHTGLAISALTRFAQAFGDSEAILIARKAITFVRQHGYLEDRQELLHSCQNTAAAVPGLLADYAFFIQGLLDAYSVIGNQAMLRWAVQLQDKVETLFGDPTGAYYNGLADPNLTFRLKEDTDGAEPSPNSVTACNLWRLGHMLQNPNYLLRGKIATLGMKRMLLRHTKSCALLMAAVSFYSQPGIEIVVVGDPQHPATLQLLAPLHSMLLLRKVITFYSQEEALFQNVAYMRNLVKTGDATLYVFEDWVLKGTAAAAPDVLPLLASLHVV